MNRRDFLSRSAAALFGFAVLPPATTYERVWRAVARPKTALVMFWSDGDTVEPVFVAARAMEMLFPVPIVEYERRENGLWARVVP